MILTFPIKKYHCTKTADLVTFTEEILDGTSFFVQWLQSVFILFTTFYEVYFQGFAVDQSFLMDFLCDFRAHTSSIRIFFLSKYMNRPEKTPYLDIFHAVIIAMTNIIKLNFETLKSNQKSMHFKILKTKVFH